MPRTQERPGYANNDQVIPRAQERPGYANNDQVMPRAQERPGYANNDQVMQTMTKLCQERPDLYTEGIGYTNKD